MTSNHTACAASPACCAFFGVVFIVAAFLFCRATPAWAGTLEDIERRGVLRLGVCSENFPPFSFRKDGEWAGFDIDLAASIAKELQVKLEIVTDPDWDGVVDLVRDGKVDIGMSCLTQTPKRTRKVNFSLPYVRQRQGVLANLSELLKIPGDDNPGKLRAPGVTIAVRTNGIYGAILSEYLPAARAVEKATYDECYESVRNGDVTGVISDEAQLMTWLGRIKGDSMRMTPIMFDELSDPISIATPMDDYRFLSFINAYLENHVYRGTVQELYWRYREDDMIVSASADTGVSTGEYLPLGISIVLASFLIVYLFRQVK